jgi:hypothetical protein
MLMLPRGITGFSSGGDPFVLPETNLHLFQTDCHAAARATGGVVAAFTVAGHGNVLNYHLARLAWPPSAKSRLLLLNAHYPYLALALPGESLRYTYADDPTLAAEFAGMYEVLAKADLDAPFRWDQPELWSALGESERKQIRYWEPATLGEIIFICWD